MSQATSSTMSAPPPPPQALAAARTRPVSTPPVAPLATSAHRLRVDRVATWAVSGGGMAIIASILGIFVFILLEVWPLVGPAHVTPGRAVAVPGSTFRAMVGDEYRTHVVGLDLDGVVRTVRLADGKIVAATRIVRGGGSEAGRNAPGIVRVIAPPGSSTLTAATTDGRVVIVPVTWNVHFEGEKRVVESRVGTPISLELDPTGRPIRTFTARMDADGTATVIAQLADGHLAIVRRGVRENPFTGEIAETLTRSQATVPVPLSHLLLDGANRSLYGATDRGALLWWQLQGVELGRPQVASAEASAITALAPLIGERSIAVGQANGAVSVWFPVRQDGGVFQLTRIRDFAPHPAPVQLIYPSMRDRGFLTVDAAGELRLQHSTTHRTLWVGRSPLANATALLYTPKADAAYLAGPGRIIELAIANPHPEISWRTLFGRVWYEGYAEPAYVWQSSGSADDFEPKLSLTPLLAGTLKGTLYSLILAIPLAVLGAMYASQFMHPTYRNIVKPTVEIMAALPSVVLGFLAGLWLAPRLERTIPALILMAVALPALVLGTGALWQRLPRAWHGRFPAGSEAFLFLFVLAGGIGLCFQLNDPFGQWAFGDGFQTWLLEHTGLTYDQRNAIVVGLAMGFAVIPIIFSVSEDALSSVPLNLISGSLALGATRWQTVTRVVLPTASPGIFSAIMIGFGRAIGETMIVLMATGNTPILDWSPFNGFRTLSANIAVEIPEAPQFGTLYRVLFLAALLLFTLTFIVNTGADLVRQRLRERYSQR